MVSVRLRGVVSVPRQIQANPRELPEREGITFAATFQRR